MGRFEQVRHRPPTPLLAPRELVVACAPLRSNVNLSRIVRTAGCCGVGRVVCCGTPKLIDRIIRDAVDDRDDGPGEPPTLAIETHRSLRPVLVELAATGYRLVGLEQTTGSVRLYDYRFTRKTALVVGNERAGLEPELLEVIHDAVEIPVYGRPLSYNVATAASMALYEYCRQFPDG